MASYRDRLSCKRRESSSNMLSILLVWLLVAMSTQFVDSPLGTRLTLCQSHKETILAGLIACPRLRLLMQQSEKVTGQLLLNMLSALNTIRVLIDILPSSLSVRRSSVLPRREGLTAYGCRNRPYASPRMAFNSSRDAASIFFTSLS